MFVGAMCVCRGYFNLTIKNAVDSLFDWNIMYPKMFIPKLCSIQCNRMYEHIFN